MEMYKVEESDIEKIVFVFFMEIIKFQLVWVRYYGVFFLLQEGVEEFYRFFLDVGDGVLYQILNYLK